MKIGMNLWTIYGWELPERPGDEVFSAIASLGVDSVELVVDEGENSPENLLRYEKEVKASLARHSLNVPTIATALFWQYNLGSRNDANRQRAIEIVDGLCRVAQTYGARAVLVVAGLQEPHTPYAQTWATAISSLRQAARVAEDLGIVIGVENVGANFLHSPGEMAAFVQAVNHPFVGSYLDIGNSMYGSCGYPENWCTALAGTIAAVHVKDQDIARNTFTYCGEGDLKWSEVLPVLRECGYDRELIIETPSDQAPDRVAGLDAATRSVAGLRRVLKAIS